MSTLTIPFFFLSLASSIIFAVLTLILFIKIVKLRGLTPGTPGVNLKNIKGLAARTAHSSLTAGVEEHEEIESFGIDGSPPPPFIPAPPADYIKPLPYVTIRGVEPKLPVSIFHTRKFWLVGGSLAFLVGILAYFFVFA